MRIIAILLLLSIGLGTKAQTKSSNIEKYADSARFFEEAAHNAPSKEQATLYHWRMNYYRIKASEAQAINDKAWQRQNTKHPGKIKKKG